MRIDWDDTKSEKLRRDRGFSFEEVSKMFMGPHFQAQKNDDPEQYLAVGFVNGILTTAVFECRQDELGEFIWLVTYWKATKSEAEKYEGSK